MHTERLGSYEVELSARQLIHNGGWAAFAAIHTLEAAADDPQAAVFPRQWVDDATVFASEAAAIAGAREAALAFLKSGNSLRPGAS